MATHEVAQSVPRSFDHASTLPRKACLADINQASVYFIAGAGLIKIGVSTNVASRFRTIRNSSPVPVELLGTVPGGTLQEAFLHHSFPHLRRHGEWFEDTPELRAHIDLCLAEQRAIRAFPTPHCASVMIKKEFGRNPATREPSHVALSRPFGECPA